MLRKELRRFKDIINVRKAEQCTQTEEQSVVSSAMVCTKNNLYFFGFHTLFF